MVLQAVAFTGKTLFPAEWLLDYWACWMGSLAVYSTVEGLAEVVFVSDHCAYTVMAPSPLTKLESAFCRGSSCEMLSGLGAIGTSIYSPNI